MICVKPLLGSDAEQGLDKMVIVTLGGTGAPSHNSSILIPRLALLCSVPLGWLIASPSLCVTGRTVR